MRIPDICSLVKALSDATAFRTSVNVFLTPFLNKLVAINNNGMVLNVTNANAQFV